VAVERLLQIIDYVVSRVTASVKPLVYHRAFLVELCEIVAVEVGVPVLSRVWQVDVRELAPAHLIYFAAIALYPCQVPKPSLVWDRNDRDFARARAIRVRTNTNHHLFVC